MMETRMQNDSKLHSLVGNHRRVMQWDNALAWIHLSKLNVRNSRYASASQGQKAKQRNKEKKKNRTRRQSKKVKAECEQEKNQDERQRNWRIENSREKEYFATRAQAKVKQNFALQVQNHKHSIWMRVWWQLTVIPSTLLFLFICWLPTCHTFITVSSPTVTSSPMSYSWQLATGI